MAAQPARVYGVSTYLYHEQQLNRSHLAEIASAGFTAVELFATRTHFDYHSIAAISDLRHWLAEARLALAAVHAPITESVVGGRFGPPYLLTSADPDVRATAVAEVERALFVARHIPYTTLVVHLGIPRPFQEAAADHNRDSARRSIDALLRVAEPLGVRLALEVIPNALSSAAALSTFIEDSLEGAPAGICFDLGHAHLAGDVAEQIEIASEYLVAAHLHDNFGRRDDHLVPFAGSIDWASALTTVQKVGYDGVLTFELAAHQTTQAVLEQARRARVRIERLLSP